MPALFLDTMTEGLFAAPVYKNYGKQILDKAYEPAGFYLHLGLKDANLVKDASDESASADAIRSMWCAAIMTRRCRKAGARRTGPRSQR